MKSIKIIARSSSLKAHNTDMVNISYNKKLTNRHNVHWQRVKITPDKITLDTITPVEISPATKTYTSKIKDKWFLLCAAGLELKPQKAGLRAVAPQWHSPHKTDKYFHFKSFVGTLSQK